jgi:3-deoxy-D-manno-octulosonic acid kinase
MLADPGAVGNQDAGGAEPLFEPEFWRRRGEIGAAARGRGSAWFIASGERRWVLRHYRRGGLIARLARDAYVWAGEDRVRSFAEWRLLALLHGRGLPVPQPVAARYQRSGLLYRCDLITRRIPDAEPLSMRFMAQPPLPESAWRAVGAAVGRLHRAGVDHADLNAHNILLDTRGAVSVIDFDRGRVRAPGGWAARNLTRLRRSLDKLARDAAASGAAPSGAAPSEETSAGKQSRGARGYSAQAWGWLLAGYADAT